MTENDPGQKMENMTEKQRAVIEFYTQNPLRTPANKAAEYAGCTESYACMIRKDNEAFIRARKGAVGPSGVSSVNAMGNDVGGGGKDEPLPGILADGGKDEFEITLTIAQWFRCVRFLPNDLSGAIFKQITDVPISPTEYNKMVDK